MQVLNLSWNLIYYLSNDTFKDMTSLRSLDIKGNNALMSMPEGLFKYLCNLNTLKIKRFNSNKMTKRFINETQSIKSLDLFAVGSGDGKFSTLIASKYINLTSVAITKCSQNELSLSGLLHQLRNLTKVHSITTVRCDFPNFESYSLGWMTSV